MRVGLAEAAHSLGVPGPQHGGNHSRENRRKYRQKRENTTKMSAKKRKAGGDTSHRARGEEGVSLRGFCGWIQRDSTEAHGPSGCCSLPSVCTSTSPQCHNYSEQLASAGGPKPPDLGPGLTRGWGGRGCGVRESRSLPCVSAGKLKIK